MLYKKIVICLLLLGLTLNVNAQLVEQIQQGANVHIEGMIVGGQNQKIFITNQVLGGQQKPFHVIDIDSTGSFSTDFTIPFRDYFIATIQSGQSINLILHGNDEIKIYADIKSLIYNCNIIGSPDSQNMLEFYREYSRFVTVEDSLKKVVALDPSKVNEVNMLYKPYQNNFYIYRNKFIQDNKVSPALIATLNIINQKNEYTLYTQVVSSIIQNFGGSGIAALLEKQKQQLTRQAAVQKALAPGVMAPEISMPNTEGDTVNLSDLRGKVVLIDFWASWCGPCRKENPNVVKAYKKYNSAGFEVFSVSFDKNGMQERWMAAIKQDGLYWPYHVSTLNGFRNQAAKDYQVSGIPFTCLIDKDGKIIATNLRGAALEAQLQKIFGF